MAGQRESEPTDCASAPAAEVRQQVSGLRRRVRDWRRAIRSRRATRLAYRVAVGAIGTAIVVGGLFLVPLPGPGWLVVFLGLAALATEFTWADRLQRFVKARLKLWTAWLRRQSWPVQALVGLGSFALVLAVVYALFLVTGTPAWVPDTVANALPGLAS